MKSIKKYKIILIAAAIIAVCTAVFIACTQIAMSSEESPVISQQSTYAAANSPGGAGANTTGKPELIDKQSALDSFVRTSNDVFGLSVDEKMLTINLSEDVDVLGSGNTRYTWDIICRDQPNKHCSVDAVTGTVISFYVKWSASYAGHPATYPSSIRSGDFSEQYAQGISSDPDSVYISLANDLVTSKLSDGRKILKIEISGVGYISENGDAWSDPNTLGTVSVVCKVYMETGDSYTLEFWGVPDDKIILIQFNTHPTKRACEFDYYYPDQAEYLLPPGWQDISEWPEDTPDSRQTP